MKRGSGGLTIRYLVAAGESLIPLESLLNRWHPGRVRQLLRRRKCDGKSERQGQNIGWICGDQSRCCRHRCRQRTALGSCAGWTGCGVRKDVRLFHGRSACPCKLVGALRDQDRSDGVHRRLLDRPLGSFREQGFQGLRRKRSSSQEPARTQDGCKGLSVVATVAYLRVINRIVPATGGDHHPASLSPTSRNAGAGSSNLHPAHSEGTHGDESTAGQRDQRYQRYNRIKNPTCDRRGGT